MYPQNDVDLARRAAEDDPGAREAVTNLAHPIISERTKTLCKEFCYDNHLNARCTLFPDWGLQEKEASLCDWGNHSYTWMLQDLTSPERLRKFDGRNGAKLTTYFYRIAFSRPFYERWKDARFGRRVRVPLFIKVLDPLAEKIFFWMQDELPIGLMAQKAKIPVKRVEELAERIVDTLMKKEKLYLLRDHKLVTTTGTGMTEGDEEEDQAEGELFDSRSLPEREVISAEILRILREGWLKLSGSERFVLNAMVIENWEAKKVTEALHQAGISIIEGISPAELTVQQLYHFRRNSIAKLARISGIQEDDIQG